MALSFQAIPPGTAFFIALPMLIRLTNCNCWSCDSQSDKRQYVATVMVENQSALLVFGIHMSSLFPHFLFLRLMPEKRRRDIMPPVPFGALPNGESFRLAKEIRNADYDLLETLVKMEKKGKTP
jgi:hypothetical protein